ncbi:MAG: hypothetical protein OEW00_05015 [candidate division Zixibacteria bacterium]|nr:hypothetical protein [candidate division Zixibacteria bacterium]
MRLALIVTVVSLLISTCVFVGCGSDDDNPAAGGSSPELFADGLIVVNPRVGLAMRLRPYGGAPFPEVDSVTLEDTLCSLNRSQYWGNGDYVYYVGFNELPSADPPMFDRGDIVRVTVHSGGKSGYCAIKLLDISMDAINIVNPGNDTAVLAGGGVDLIWSRSDNADWYAVQIEKNWDSAGMLVATQHYATTRDTAWSVPATFCSADASFLFIRVIPMTGPDPFSNAGNWSGSLVAGWLYSWAGFDQVLIGIVPAGVVKRQPRERPINSMSNEEAAALVRSVCAGLREDLR